MGYTTGQGAVISVSVDGAAASQRQIDNIAQSMGNLSSVVQGTMRNLAATAGIGGGLVQVVQLSDEYTKFTAQLRLATQSQGEYQAALEGVRRIAHDTQAELGSVGVLYARISNGTRELGLAQKQVADITEVVNLALKVSGATTEEAASAQLQLSQSFASGTLRGEEFNAVNEAAPRLMKALAEGIGVPVGALKQMASEGKITSEVMAAVLPKSLEQLRHEAQQVQTISGAFTDLKNRVLEYTATSAQANGTVAVLTGGINLLSNNLQLLAGTLTTITAVKAANWATEWVTAAYNKVAADQASRAAALAAAQADLARVQATTAQAAATQAAIVIAREEAAARLTQANSNVLAARAAVEAATAAGAQSFAMRTLRLATGELQVAEAARSAMLAELAVLGQQQVRVSAEIAAARVAETAATTAANAAQGAGAVAAGLASRAVGLLGGPVGAIVTLLGLAATAWSVYGSKSEEANQRAADSTALATPLMVENLELVNAKLRERLALAKAGLPELAKVDSPETQRLASTLKQITGLQERQNELKRQGKDLDVGDQVALITLQGIYSDLAKSLNTNKNIKHDIDASGTALTDLIAVRERLSGVDKQYLEDLGKLEKAREKGAIGDKEYIALVSQLATETYKKSEAGKEATSSANKEKEAYATLISSIREKIDANRLELAAGENATDSQKAQVKLDEELASGKLKLSAAHQAVARAAIAGLAVSEQALKLAAAERDVTKYIVASTEARDAAVASLNVEYAMYGRNADAREIAMVAVRAQADMEKKLSDLREAKKPVTDQMIAQLNAETKARILVEQATLAQGKALGYAAQLAEENKRFGVEYIADDKARASATLALDAQVWRERIANAGEGTEAQKLLQQEYDTWYRNQLLRPQLDEQKKMWDSIEQTAHDTFISIFDSGKSAFDRLRDALKNGLLDLLYQLTVKRWVVSIGASVSMGASGMAQASNGGTGDVFASAASASTNPLIQAVGVASNLYTSITKGLSGIGDSIATSMGSGITSLGQQFGSEAVTTFGQGMQGFGADGSLGGLSGAGATTGSLIGTISGTVAGYMIGSTLNSAISGKYTTGSGVMTVEKVATAAAAAFFGPVGGAVAGAISGGINRLFGMGPTETQAMGLRGNLSASGVTGETYQQLHQDGGVFRSDKDWTDKQALTTATSAQLTQAFGAIKFASGSFAQTLGLGTDALAGYSKAFDITFTKDAAANQKAIADFFTGVGDELAKMLVPTLDQFSRSGESAAATLERLAGDFKGTDQIAQLLGFSASQLFGATGLDSVKSREQLIDMAGGLQALSQYASTFNQNFLTDAERLAPVSAALDKALSSLGLSTIPTTRDEFKALVNNLITSGAAATESGAKQLDSLLALGEAFAQVHPQIDAAAVAAEAAAAAAAATAAAAEKAAAAVQAVKDQASTMLGGVNDAYSALQNVVGREKSAIQVSVDTHTAAFNRLQSLSQELHSTLDSLRSPDQKLAERARAQAEIRADLAITKAGGSLSDVQVESLKRALGAVTQDASKQFGSREDYMFDLLRTQSDIAQLGNITDNSLSVEQKSLDALNEQIKRLDEIVMNGQAQIDALNGQSVAPLSLAQAMAAFQSSIGTAQTNPVVGGTAGLAGLYQSLFERAPDQAGLQYWQNALAGGMSLSQVSDFFKQSDEYKKLHPFAAGTNFVPETMPSLVHQGERIIPAADNRALMARLSSPVGNNAVLAAELKALREEVQGLRAEARATAGHAAKTACLLKRVIRNDSLVTSASDTA